MQRCLACCQGIWFGLFGRNANHRSFMVCIGYSLYPLAFCSKCWIKLLQFRVAEPENETKSRHDAAMSPVETVEVPELLRKPSGWAQPSKRPSFICSRWPIYCLGDCVPSRRQVRQKRSQKRCNRTCFDYGRCRFPISLSTLNFKGSNQI